jgi:hypothetical protein
MFPNGGIGNKYAKKLVTPELKEQAYKQYCAHLAKGKSKRSWRFKHPDVSLRWETMEKYAKESPEEFDPEHIKDAISDGYAHWEQIVEDSAEGINQKANTASLQMKMRNKFGWDKNDHKEEEDSTLEVRESQQNILNQIQNYQSNPSFPVA